jgi:hypothetical protein
MREQKRAAAQARAEAKAWQKRGETWSLPFL